MWKDIDDNFYDDIIEHYQYNHTLVYKKDKWVQSKKQDKRFDYI